MRMSSNHTLPGAQPDQAFPECVQPAWNTAHKRAGQATAGRRDLYASEHISHAATVSETDSDATGHVRHARVGVVPEVVQHGPCRVVGDQPVPALVG
jgi:hypothetical protein